MSDLITIQNFCDRNTSEPMICSFETETISTPTSPILHSMARIWCRHFAVADYRSD